MNLLSLVPDNLSEILLKILRFTELRRNVLYHNEERVDDADFRPRDMPVVEFAAVLNAAVAEHLQSRRLIFRDTDNVRFGPDGAMELRALTDEHAETLLHADRNAYAEHQKSLWQENTLNQTVAQELLELTCGPCANAIRLQNGITSLDWDRLEGSWKHCEKMD